MTYILLHCYIVFQAVREGYTFKTKHLMMAWHKPNKPKTPTTPKAPTTPKTPTHSSVVSSPASVALQSPLITEQQQEEEEEEEAEDIRDDDPLEGEDLVGGPGNYGLEQGDEVSTFVFIYFIQKKWIVQAKIMP